MIGSLIHDILNTDAAINAYATGGVFVGKAPVNTPTPYIVIKVGTSDDYGVINVFTIEITIYDDNDDTSNMENAMRGIRNALDRAVLDGDEHNKTIRIWFENAPPLAEDEDDQNLAIAKMTFTARAFNVGNMEQ